MGLCFGKPSCYSKSSVNDNNSGGSRREKESQSDNLWPFVGHFLKDHNKQEAATELGKVLMLSCTNSREKKGRTRHMYSKT